MEVLFRNYGIPAGATKWNIEFAPCAAPDPNDCYFMPGAWVSVGTTGIHGVDVPSYLQVRGVLLKDGLETWYGTPWSALFYPEDWNATRTEYQINWLTGEVFEVVIGENEFQIISARFK